MRSVVVHQFAQTKPISACKLVSSLARFNTMLLLLRLGCFNIKPNSSRLARVPVFFIERNAMNILTLPMRTARNAKTDETPDHKIGTVFQTHDIFASRAYPLGCWVRHADHGDGEVIGLYGHTREVRFESMESKDAHELSFDEIPHGVDASNLVNVAWIRTELYSVPAGELQLLRKVAVPQHKRWAY